MMAILTGVAFLQIICKKAICICSLLFVAFLQIQSLVAFYKY